MSHRRRGGSGGAVIDTLAGHLARLETTAASRWPTGSQWRHVSLGVVTVARLTRAHNSPSPEQVGTVWYHRVCEPTPEIVDAAGRRWSCFAPDRDLAPVTTELAAAIERRAEREDAMLGA